MGESSAWGFKRTSRQSETIRPTLGRGSRRCRRRSWRACQSREACVQRAWIDEPCARVKKIEPSDKIFLDQSTIPGAGRGVFAKRALTKGEVIEVCPVIEIPLTDSSNDDQNGSLTNYFFYFGNGLAVVLGFGSIYNNSYTPNATYIKKPSDGVVEFQATEDIEAGINIIVNYNNGDPDDKSTSMNKGVLLVS